MASEKLYKKLRIFIASPNDVAAERARLHTVAEEFNRTGNIGDLLGVTLEVLDWQTHVSPYMGRPQAVVFNQLPVGSWDIFIGILWLRFGTPPGEVDPRTGTSFGSGTEEEFRTAYACWTNAGRPKMLVYRCTRVPQQLDDIDPDQHKRVKEFFNEFKASGKNPGLPQSFQLTEEFERRVRQDLIKLLLEFGKDVLNKEPPAAIIEAAAPPVPDTLPRRAPFFGREREIKQALRALGPQDRGWGLVIDGIGGIGKTALAVEVAYVCKQNALFDAFVFVSAKQDELKPSGIQDKTLAATTLDDLINRAARALGQPGIEKLSAGEERREAFLDTLRSHRALLIFDNLETLTAAEQNAVGDLLRELPQDCKAIITSRTTGSESAYRLRLEKLEWEDARQLIEDQMERYPDVKRQLSKVGEDRWKQLYDSAGGSPLALIWTLGLINARGWSFESGLKLLHEGGTESDLNRFIFGAARKAMDANEHAALCALSLFGGPATFEALSAAADLNRHVLANVLERLRALSLVDLAEGDAAAQQSTEERYLLLPLTKRFAAADLEGDPALAAATKSRFVRYWTDYASRYGGDGTENFKTYDRLEAELVNLDTAANMLWEMAGVKEGNVEDKEAARRITELALKLYFYLLFSGRWDIVSQLLIWGYYAALALNNYAEAGDCAMHAATHFLRRSLDDDAASWSRKAIDLQIKGGNELQQAHALAVEGQVLLRQNKINESEQLMQQALDMYRRLRSERGVAFALGIMANIKKVQTKYEEAESNFVQALDIYRKLNSRDGISALSVRLGNMQLERELWSEAEKLFREALQYAQEIGRLDSMAYAQFGCAEALKGQGETESAMPLAQEALTIFERLRHPEAVKVREFIAQLATRGG